jgi:hypothetical protein
MLFIMRQQVQPAFISAAQHSQQAWIIAQQLLSPLVQVMQTPSSVGSHLHIPIIRLQVQTATPFIIMQQEHIPPASMVHRFWSMPAETLSSHEQVIFMPPLHFSIVIVQRGTIIMFVPPGSVAGVPNMPAPKPAGFIPATPIAVRSIIIELAMTTHPPWCLVGSNKTDNPHARKGGRTGPTLCRPRPEFQCFVI